MEATEAEIDELFDRLDNGSGEMDVAELKPALAKLQRESLRNAVSRHDDALLLSAAMHAPNTGGVFVYQLRFALAAAAHVLPGGLVTRASWVAPSRIVGPLSYLTRDPCARRARVLLFARARVTERGV